MFLRSIELFGFKSFPERTRIEFAEGITALLGPNGCGKSNIVDAVKWVLGEQSTKSLRADSMEDVIFNGTENRKPVNWAEVILTLSNETGILDLDLPEITVGRRLFRNGESEYSINKSVVKLKDVRDLFMDTGVGKSAYSIMEQGRIDQILSNKPEERRYIFEEAAGISKYKSRSAEAERKLEKTEENLRQVEGILTEVKRSYDTLRNQSAKTEQFRRLRKDIFSVEKQLTRQRLKTFRHKEEETSLQLQQWEAQRHTLNQELNKINDSMGEGLAGVGQWENNLKDIQKLIHELEIGRSQTLAQEKILQERKSALLEQSGALEREILRLQSEMSEKAAQAAQLALEGTQLERNVAQDAENIAQFEERLQNLSQQINHHTEQADRLSVLENKLQDEVQTATRELTGLTEGLVRAIDEGIARDPGLWDSIQTWHEQLGGGLEKLVLSVKGRHHRLSDLINAGKTLAEDNQDSWLEALEQAVRLAEDLATAWKRYEGSAPAILRELLSPHGTLTQKRQVDARVADLHAQIAASREERSKLLEHRRNLEEQTSSFRETLEELKINQVRREAQRQAVAAEIQRLSDEEGILKSKIAEAGTRKQEDAARVSVLDAEVGKLLQEMAALTQREGELRREEEVLRGKILQENASLGEKERFQKELFASLSKLQENIEKKSRENGEHRADIRALLENFKERHGTDLDEEAGGDTQEPSEQLRQTLQELKETQKALGQVNLMAPEEFAEVSQRYDFLNQQIADLRSAREDLRGIVIEIKKESTLLFENTFVQIQKNFHDIFRRLFGGGRAEVRLTHEGDVLDAGVEMLCQPPGKRLESISLLSGGERSLTAVALLFAVYMVRPSPFCILDEIDAALDESNVGRFTSMLREFAGSSQFIVITHNKRTVTGAGSMIGVTMEESGVSKVLAIRVNEPAGMP